jgi:hypothetical protein
VKLQRYPRNTQCIPAVKIYAFLELEQISADFGLKRFETGSLINKYLKLSIIRQINHLIPVVFE